MKPDTFQPGTAGGVGELNAQKTAPFNPFAVTRHQRMLLVTALILATLLKLLLAFASRETLDSNAFLEFLHHIRETGGTAAYGFRGSHNNIFNFPPPMLHVIRGLGFVADSTGIPFKFWLRSLPSLADVGSFFLVWKLLQPRKDLFRLLFLLALCPLSIVINGFEGNVDALMIFFLLLSIWLIETSKPIWIAGIAFGMALSVKFVPLMFVPVLFLYLPNLKSRLAYFASAAGTFVICSLPFIVKDPTAIKGAVFGYSSIYGVWGITKMALISYGPPHLLYPPYDPTGGHSVFGALLKYFMLGTICVVSLWMNWRLKKPSLIVQCGTIVALFLFLTPGFGVQYLVWLVPFVLAAGLRATLIYYATTFWFAGFALGYWGLASENLYLGIMFICWLSAAIVALEFHRSSVREM